MWGRGGCSLECIFLMMMMSKRCKSLERKTLSFFITILEEKTREFDGERVPLDFR